MKGIYVISWAGWAGLGWAGWAGWLGWAGLAGHGHALLFFWLGPPPTPFSFLLFPFQTPKSRRVTVFPKISHSHTPKKPCSHNKQGP